MSCVDVYLLLLFEHRAPKGLCSVMYAQGFGLLSQASSHSPPPCYTGAGEPFMVSGWHPVHSCMLSVPGSRKPLQDPCCMLPYQEATYIIYIILYIYL